jgi:hypothetical protein
VPHPWTGLVPLPRFQDEDFEEDEGIYDDLHLEEEEEAFATAQLIKEPSEDLDDILSVSEGEIFTTSEYNSPG